MVQASVAARMEQAIRTYIDACNADADAISRCFEPDAEHFFPAAAKWSGSKSIGANFAKVVTEKGRAWTVDQVVIDEQRALATFEWTQSTDRPGYCAAWTGSSSRRILFASKRFALISRSDPIQRRLVRN
jgi:hypothetical protein